MANKPSLLRRFIGGLWRTVALLYSLLFLVILIAIPVAIYFALHTPRPTVPDSGVLVIAPSGPLVEQADPLGSVVGSLFSSDAEPAVTRHVIRALDRAAADDRIKTVLLRLDEFTGGAPGQLQDVAGAIDRFKSSGKQVVAWSSAYDQAAYALASQADTVVLDPLGYVFLQGYGVYNRYYKNALDELGIDVNVFRVGRYKSYVEPFTRTSMSDDARADALNWTRSLWSTYRDVVTGDRPIDAADIDAYVANFADRLSNLNGDAAELARQAGLVDRIAPMGDVRQRLVEQAGRDADTGSFPRIGVADYLADTSPEVDDEGARIALVTVEGQIVDGESATNTAGGETVARLIDAARRDDQIAAMVLRVNSPGGSVTASEHIRRQVVAMREAGKPVVVSMAGVAASGGYWISMNADQIWAEPSTITGSIGIFAVVPTFNDTLDKVGVQTDGVGTTDLSGAFRLDTPLSPQARQIFQAGVEHGYREFIGRVAQARGLSSARVDEIAQGRVWSGEDAERLSLVDALGDLVQAETAAARLAGLDVDDYRIQPMTPPTDWRGALTQAIDVRLADALLPGWLSSLAGSEVPAVLEQFNDPRGLYARCFCRVTQSSQLSATSRQADFKRMY